MRRALDRLPQRMRAAVVLRYYEDMSEPEIADALGVGSRHRQEHGVACGGQTGGSTPSWPGACPAKRDQATPL